MGEIWGLRVAGMGTPCLSGLGWVLGVGLVLLPLLPLGWEEGEDAHCGLPLHNFGVSWFLA